MALYFEAPARQWLAAASVAIWSPRLGLRIAVRTSGFADDPRYAAFTREWGVDAPRSMFVFLQNPGFGSLADAPLKDFRPPPASQGQVCDAGPWRWSRHPDYFFEWLGWVAYPVIAISPDHPPLHPWGRAALLAPAFMYWILVHVTGIRPLAAQPLRSRGERYRDWQSRTSVFFPLPPHQGVVT